LEQHQLTLAPSISSLACYFKNDLVRITFRFDKSSNNHFKQAQFIPTAKMQLHLLTTLLILFLGTLTLSAPATTQTTTAFAFNVNRAWKIMDIVIFDATQNSTVNSTLSFTFEDPNQGMELKANCNRTVAPGQPLASNFYQPCGPDSNLAFQYYQDQLWIYRAIFDPR
jgi:hypothetical protein